jgi:hypothetical protein
MIPPLQRAVNTELRSKSTDKAMVRQVVAGLAEHEGWCTDDRSITMVRSRVAPVPIVVRATP